MTDTRTPTLDRAGGTERLRGAGGFTSTAAWSPARTRAAPPTPRRVWHLMCNLCGCLLLRGRGTVWLLLKLW